MARNWYPFYVGDYARKTSHLTLEQHGAYRLLLDYYYSTGVPLPLEMKTIYRICRAVSRRERDTISTIIEQFFDKTSDGFVSEKCQTEIYKALKYSETQSANAYARHHAKDHAKSMPARASTTTTKKDSVGKEPTGALAPLEVDFKRLIFNEGLRYLERSTKKPEVALRPIIGKWCSQYGDAPTATAIMECQKFSANDPISYIINFLKEKKHEAYSRTFTKNTSKSERFKQALIDDTIEELDSPGPVRGPAGD